MIATTQPITIPNLTLLEIKSQIETMPQLSKVALDLLGRSESHFSKSILTNKITEAETLRNKCQRLETSECYDRSRAIGCCALNTLWGIGIPLSAGLIPNVAGAIGGAVGSAICYTINGGVNFHCADQPDMTFIGRSEDGEEVCFGFCFGPCFAGYEARYQIPLRIENTRNAAATKETFLRQAFENLLWFSLDENAVNTFQSNLSKCISNLDSEIQECETVLAAPVRAEMHLNALEVPLIAEFNEKSAAGNSDILSVATATSTAIPVAMPKILQKALEDSHKKIEKEKASFETKRDSYLTVPQEIADFVQYFKEKNPS